MEIPVLDQTGPNSQVDKYIDYLNGLYPKKEIALKLQNNFSNVYDGIVFVGLEKETGPFPKLMNSTEKILYVYLVGEQTLVKNMKGCEMVITDSRPSKSLFLHKFKKIVDIFEINGQIREIAEDIFDADYIMINRFDNWLYDKYNVLKEYESMVIQTPPVPTKLKSLLEQAVENEFDNGEGCL